MADVMSPELQPVFVRLRAILAGQAGTLSVTDDTPQRYCLAGAVGPATVRAWRGKTKQATIPVASVEVNKSYISYHLMGVYGNPGLLDSISAKLKARMQGKSCFNFRSIDEPLFAELERLTVAANLGFQRAGFISAGKST